MGYGMAGHVMLQFQNSFGTMLTASLQTIPVVSESFVQTIEQLTEAGMYARFGESPYHEGMHKIEGSVSVEAEPTTIGHFLKAAFGTVATTSGTGIQTHVFKPMIPGSEFDKRCAVQPMTFEVNMDVGSAAVFYDMVANQITISVANGELLTMETAFVGAGFTRKAASTPSFPTGKPFLWDQSSISFNGQDVLELEELSVTLNNNVEATYVLAGSKAPARIKRTAQQQIEITGTLLFESHSYWQAYQAQSELPFKAHFKNSATPHTFTMDFSKMRLKTFEPQISDAGLVRASFTAGAMFDTASATAATFTLVNTQTYY